LPQMLLRNCLKSRSASVASALLCAGGQEEHDMANSQPQRTGSGREIVMLVGVLALVAVGGFATYWARSEDAEASGQSVAAAPAPAPAPSPRTGAVSSSPIVGEVVHADVSFGFKSPRLTADAVRLLQEKAGMMEHA